MCACAHVVVHVRFRLKKGERECVRERERFNVRATDAGRVLQKQIRNTVGYTSNGFSIPFVLHYLSLHIVVRKPAQANAHINVDSFCAYAHTR